VTSIAVRTLASGQAKSFPIHLIAERRGLIDSIEQHYDQLAREMLKVFCEEARARQHCKWIHWNMGDSNYGFEALENRMKALGDTPVIVRDANRYHLSRLLVSVYGTGYVGHPRLEQLMKLNHVTPRDFLKGAQEAAAFEGK
jgi:hypothetical protein